MREIKTDSGQESPFQSTVSPPAAAEEERAALSGETIRWVTVTTQDGSRLQSALRRDGQGPYLLCGCGQIIRPGDELLAAGEHFYCPDCAGLWLAANLSCLGGMFP